MAQLQFKSTDTALWEEKFGNGSDGSLTISGNTTDSPTKTTCSISSGSTTLTVGSATGFSVNDLVIIHQTRNGTATPGTWMLNKINNISGTTFTMKYAAVDTFNTTAQVQKILQYDAVTVNSGVTWTASAWDGSIGGILAFLCNGTTTITGTIDARQKGYRGSSGNVAVGASGRQGEGTAGAGETISSSANGSGGGGGVGTNGTPNSGEPTGSGGGGGHAASGENGSTATRTNGTGGSTSGNAALTTMTFGGGSGSTGATSFYGGTLGRAGGGIVLIISKNITISGSITVAGTDGPSFSNNTAGGGGSAGGSVLIKAQTATLGTSLISAAGGVGGGSSSQGGDGSVGRLHLDYLTSYTGTTSPTLDATQDSSLTSAGGGSGSGGAAFLFNFI